MRVLAAAVLLLLSACAQTSGEASVTRQGFSYRDGALGVAALIETDVALDDIALRVGMYEGDELVDEQRSTLPFCLPDVECWWAESYTTAPRGVDRIAIDVRGGTRTNDARRIVKVNSGSRASASGTLYRVVTHAGEPVWGTSVHAQHGDRLGAGYLYVGAAVDRGEPGAD